MKRILWVCLGLSLAYGAWGQGHTPRYWKKPSALDTLKGAWGPSRSCYDLRHIALNLRLDTETARLAGSATLRVVAQGQAPALQVDLDKRLNIDSAFWSRAGQNVRAAWRRDTPAVLVTLPATWQKGQTWELTVFYQGRPRLAINPPWDGGIVRRFDKKGRPWYGMAVQGTGGQLWYPAKDHPLDEPEEGAQVSLDIPDTLQFVGNGRPMGSRASAAGRKIQTWAVSQPINAYNLTLNVGKYVLLRDSTQSGGRWLPLRFWVLEGNEGWARVHFQQVKPMLACFDQHFGPYPFAEDGYQLIESDYWGMEHQSAVAYGNHFVNNRWGFDFIIAHESGHEWWGNSVTAADPADFWIQEGFCTYSETLLMECLSGKTKAEEYINNQKKHIKNTHPLVGPRGVAYHHYPDNDVYYKGAWVLNTLRNWLNNDTLFVGTLRDFAIQYRHKAVSSDELVAFFSRRMKLDLAPFFAFYLHQPALPQLALYVEKGVLWYKWNSNFSGLPLPIRLQTGPGTEQALQPSSQIWQSIPLQDLTLDLSHWKDNYRRYLIEIVRLTQRPQIPER